MKDMKARGRIIPPSFFARDTARVARELLGKYLVRRMRGKDVAFMITEVEAYDGFSDRASHASRGMTPRNRVMFGPPGRWYVYLVYGMHDMLNIVTRERAYPAAILIRGIEGATGPGTLTKKLGITRAFSGKPASRRSRLFIEDRGVRIPNSRIESLPRVGVEYAGKHWVGKKWRFRIKK